MQAGCGAGSQLAHTHGAAAELGRQAGGGRGDVVRLLDMGADVALITVQVEIVTGIDCASKCYTSHLSFFFLYLFFLVERRLASQLQRC